MGIPTVDSKDIGYFDQTSRQTAISGFVMKWLVSDI
jgi:hypothetical protein